MKSVAFIPDPSPGVSVRATDQSVDADADTFRLALEVEINPASTQNLPPTLAGVVNLGTETDHPAFSVSIDLSDEEGASGKNDDEDDLEGDG